MQLSFDIIIKVIPYIFLGWLFTRFKFRNAALFVKYFIDFALYFLIPIFTFFTMWEAPLSANLGNTESVVFASLVVFFFSILFSFTFSKMFHLKYRDIALPIIFMNSGYLAIPLNTIFFGKEGTFYSIIYNTFITILTFTYGLWLVAGKVKEVFRIPILYFAFLGILFSILDIKLNERLVNFSKVLNSVTIPVMLCLVGYQLQTIEISMLKKVSVGVFMRMFGGLIVAYIFCRIFNVTGTVRGVCLLSSAMPSAVVAFILNKKYNADYLFASSMIAVGMLVTIIIVPVVLWLK